MNEAFEGRFSKKARKTLRVLRHLAREDVLADRLMGYEAVSAYHNYEYYDSSIEKFNRDFANIMAGEVYLQDFVKHQYTNKVGVMRAMELGGPARRLFLQGFTPGIFSATAGVVLQDIRTEDEQVRDAKHNHDVISANVFTKDGDPKFPGWNTVEEWVDKHGKPDLLIERMVGPLHDVHSTDAFVAILSRWFSLLNEKGTIFFEVPRKFRTLYPDELDSILYTLCFNTPFISGEYDLHSDETDGVMVRITKLPGCPPELRDVLKK